MEDQCGNRLTLIHLQMATEAGVHLCVRSLRAKKLDSNVVTPSYFYSPRFR